MSQDGLDRLVFPSMDLTNVVSEDQAGHQVSRLSDHGGSGHATIANDPGLSFRAAFSGQENHASPSRTAAATFQMNTSLPEDEVWERPPGEGSDGLEGSSGYEAGSSHPSIKTVSLSPSNRGSPIAYRPDASHKAVSTRPQPEERVLLNPRGGTPRKLSCPPRLPPTVVFEEEIGGEHAGAQSRLSRMTAPGRLSTAEWGFRDTRKWMTWPELLQWRKAIKQQSEWGTVEQEEFGVSDTEGTDICPWACSK